PRRWPTPTPTLRSLLGRRQRREGPRVPRRRKNPRRNAAVRPGPDRPARQHVDGARVPARLELRADAPSARPIHHRPTEAMHMTTTDTAAHLAHEAYVHAINSNDTNELLKTVTDDIVYLPPNSAAIAGKSAVGQWLEEYFGAFSSKWVKTTVEFVVRD